jgi:glycine/D-amino acid oxidase-like deaminating enzyme
VHPTVAPGRAIPWWLEEALAAEGDVPEPEPLEGDTRADVAIVGGGYTGLWTALALKEREPSLDVVVLEAETVGLGPSGRNGGFVHGWWGSLHELRHLFGDEAALELCRAGDRIIPGIRALTERVGRDVWLREGGTLLVSAAPAQDRFLPRGVAAARELGVPEEAVPLTQAEVAEHVRSPVFRGGVRTGGATIQPARLARTLRAAALDAGVRLHERTPARLGSDGVLRTPRGRVTAPEVVLAANARLASFRPLAPRITVFGSYVVLTEPVPELLEEIGWTGGEAISDARTFLHYFRTTNDGRVLMGSGSGPIAWRGRVDERFSSDAPTGARAERGLRRLLPGLAGAKVTHSWGGPIDVSSDHLPFFGTLPGRRVHFGAGFSGNGAGPSWVGGQVLASLVLRSDDEWAALPLANRLPPWLPPEPFRRVGGGLVRASIMAVEEAEEEGRRPPLAARAGAAIPRLVGMEIGTR